MNADTILEDLRENAESISNKDDAGTWGMVYLDNAKPSGCNRHQFAGFLSVLESRGLYRSTGDSYFGEVLLLA
jgi:hypothetical protein